MASNLALKIFKQGMILGEDDRVEGDITEIRLGVFFRYFVAKAHGVNGQGHGGKVKQPQSRFLAWDF